MSRARLDSTGQIALLSVAARVSPLPPAIESLVPANAIQGSMESTAIPCAPRVSSVSVVPVSVASAGRTICVTPPSDAAIPTRYDVDRLHWTTLR